MPTLNPSVPTVTATFVPTVVEFNNTASALADLQQRFGDVVFEVSTEQGFSDAKSGRSELKNLRVGLEKKRVTLNAPLLARTRLINDEAKRITEVIQGLETPIDASIKAEEQRREEERAERERAEQVRIQAIQAKLAEIREIPLKAVGLDAAAILKMAAETDVLVIDTAFFGGYANEASVARNAAAAKLRQLHDTQIIQEQHIAQMKAAQDAAEKLAREQAAIAEQERIAREAQEAAEKLAREQIEAQQRAEQAAKDAIAKAEQEAAAAALQAERDAFEQEKAKQAAQDEQERLAREAQANAEKLAREQAEAKMRAEREKLEQEQAKLAQEQAALELRQKAEAEAEAAAVRIKQERAEAAALEQKALADTLAAQAASDAAKGDSAAILTEARTELTAFRAKFSAVPELAGVLSAIDAFIG